MDYITTLTTPIFEYQRELSQKEISNDHGIRYGPYLYKNKITEELISSHDKPKQNISFYKGEDIGYNTDALIFHEK